MKRDKMLDTAKEMVCGYREQDYGTPEDNFSVIAKYWSVYLNKEIKASDVANMMCLFKLGRITSGSATEDSYVDLAGYAACASEIMSIECAKENIKYDNQNNSVDIDKKQEIKEDK